MAASDDIHRAHSLLANADRVLIGASVGLSTAAGLAYSGERFQRYFAPFIERYGMTDMYSAGFYPFPTQEDKWAYWSQHIWLNRFEPGATPLYRRLFEWVCDRDYFVITTNVDAQFELAGFDPQRIFATQGDYGYIQCARGCHNRIYPVRNLMEEWRSDLGARSDGTLERTRLSDPALVPTCPVCCAPTASSWRPTTGARHSNVTRRSSKGRADRAPCCWNWAWAGTRPYGSATPSSTSRRCSALTRPRSCASTTTAPPPTHRASPAPWDWRATSRESGVNLVCNGNDAPEGSA